MFFPFQHYFICLSLVFQIPIRSQFYSNCPTVVVFDLVHKKMVNLKIISPFRSRKFQDINKYDSFHQAIMPVLFFNQVFGILPVIGFTNGDVRQVRYKVKSFRFVYSVITLISISYESMSALLTMGEIRLNNIGKEVNQFSTKIAFQRSRYLLMKAQIIQFCLCFRHNFLSIVIYVRFVPVFLFCQEMA